METKRLHITKGGDVEVEFADAQVVDAYDTLALEALDECRASLAMGARYLNAALWRLPFERAPLSRTLSVGGRVLRYDPENVVVRYREDPAELVRDCLHAVLHCVFHHPFDTRHGEFDTWSLACDVSVELCAIELVGTRFPSDGDAERLALAKRLTALARNTTAPALYQALRHGEAGERLYESSGIDGAFIARLRELFARDLHELWAGHPHVSPQEPGRVRSAGVPDLQTHGGGDEAEAVQAGNAWESEAPNDGGEGGASEQPVCPGEDEARDGDGAESRDSALKEATAPTLPLDEDALRANEQELEEWSQVSKRVEAELRMQKMRSSSGDGSMLLNLSVANKKAANYEEFLRKFATVAEDLRVSDDEFDYIFYTYGLNRYGNVPLVEPLEYTEQARVREFVIALDTSGSCSGRLIREFVERTYSILRQRTSFGDNMNVYIVQCDKQIRSATKITSLRQLEEYADSFWVSGGGGTDFKPVFSYVDSLVDAGEFSDLRGLVYFTDGYGTFPTRAPDYDVAFVFVDVEGMEVRVPPWAMKVVMTQDEIRTDP